MIILLFLAPSKHKCTHALHGQFPNFQCSQYIACIPYYVQRRSQTCIECCDADLSPTACMILELENLQDMVETKVQPLYTIQHLYTMSCMLAMHP